ncbi:class I SAM-dependent methyltransferase [Archangium lipolyticum]|uniref:class I SAM-dependent methyltransferase n=1 Tax=Archangium lipolyticum TaxID=2970465 RepID=UPI002149DE7D|nr:methyltransferase domain-containing protein [Archangium lipolyticum]
MYLTKINAQPVDGNFDWNGYFSARQHESILEGIECRGLLESVRAMLAEDNAVLTLSLTRVLRALLKDTPLAKPRILELGAATGYLTRWLLHRYGGHATLVDNSPGSHAAYLAVQDPVKEHIDYVRSDLFALDLPREFDLTCSFGLIEHFADKREVLAAHRRFMKEGGRSLVVIPLDTKLTRVFYEVHPEQNLGYRELLTIPELKAALTDAGFEVLGVEVSQGFAYDYAAALCR